MSEPGKDSVPTSADPRSKRPTKRRQLTPVSEQANQINVLFKDPSKDVRLPPISKPRTADSLAPPPEVVANVQGSSAGAGSGEFHVYKASRRREYERLRLMEEESKREKSNEEFLKKKAEMERLDQQKTDRNRRKREKRKAAAAAKPKNGPTPSTTEMDVDGETEKKTKNTPGPSRLGPLPSRDEDHALPEGSDGQQIYEEQGVIIHDDD